MMYGNGRPAGNKTRMRLLVAVVLLAWATQTLLHQWGYGAEAPAPQGSEKFVPGRARFTAGAVLELRGEAVIAGSQARLRQVCRWSDADAPIFAPIGDLVVARISATSPFRVITLDEIRATLHDAGVNLGTVRFAGPMSCMISRSDGELDSDKALLEWAKAAGRAENAENGDAGTRRRGDADNQDMVTRRNGDPEKQRGTERSSSSALVLPPGPLVAPSWPSILASPRPRVPASPADSPVRSLRALLTSDLSVRLGIPEDQLQVAYNPKDEKLLNLAEPLFRFNVEPRQIRDLGEVSWEVLIVAGEGSQKARVSARARAWQRQVVVARPLSYHQVIQSADVIERRVLADRLSDEPLLSLDQVVGQEAARDLKDGTILTARLVDAVPLVKPGQLVTITLQVGAVSVKSVGRAMEGGSYGQTIKVRNDATRDILEVTMTGPQDATMGPLPTASTLASVASKH